MARVLFSPSSQPDRLPLKSIAEERAFRLRSRGDDGAESEKLFLQSVGEFANGSDKDRLIDIFEFAKSIQYHHPGLTPGSYLAHPLRVVSMALELVRPVDLELILVALLHNVFEVSTKTQNEISERVGQTVATTIATLTIDRSQKSHEYKEKYYRELAQTGRTARIIKILDKLDNLFLLCLNPDEEVRRAYLQEVSEFILPFVCQDLPGLVVYFEALIEECRKTDYLPTASSQPVNSVRG